MIRLQRLPVCLLACFALASVAGADEPVVLSEAFAVGSEYRVDIRVEISGRMTIPSKDGKPQLVTVVGKSVLNYDERVLPSDEAGTEKVLRAYRDVQFARTIGISGDREQRADIRKDVRRMVVIRKTLPNRSAVKSPFSPDGPLMWSEIDIVRSDLFSASLVPAILSEKAVKVGDKWQVSPAAVSELTDMEKFDEGGFAVKFVALANVNQRLLARLALSGTVKGIDEHGPCRHTIEGTAYFDIEAKRLSYLSITGSHELLDGNGKTAGRVEGQLTMNRTASRNAVELSDEAIQTIETKPTIENSVLLYANPDLGVRFIYPRRWRIGTVQGRQLTLDGPNGAGILLTLESPTRLPTAAAYLEESLEFLKKAKAKTANVQQPKRVQDKPAVDRFALDADLDGQKVRMDYTVVTQSEGGITIATRLLRTDADELTEDLDRIAKSMSVTKLLK